MMPVTSKIFLGLTLVLAVALIVSLWMLQSKRTEDAMIQRASELLHEGQTKQQAAAAALIYNNREQAQTLLQEAQDLANQLTAMGLYADETDQLKRDIQGQYDRVHLISRVTEDTTDLVGDLAAHFTREKPSAIFFADNALYTFHPTTNAVWRMSADGDVAALTDTTQGIGYFTRGVANDTDKQLIFLTGEPDVVLVDVKTAAVTRQDIAWPAAEANITAFATYGSRLYVYDATTHNIHAYSKTLRGYTGRQAWVVNNESLPRDLISIAVDGSVYTLHKGGTIREFFKGELRDSFSTEAVDPPLQSASRVFTTPDHRNIYVLDESNNRVVIFNKQGKLQRQTFLSATLSLTDMAVSSDEKTLYLLAGTKVFKAGLAE